jgi:hypothetical protein
VTGVPIVTVLVVSFGWRRRMAVTDGGRPLWMGAWRMPVMIIVVVRGRGRTHGVLRSG